MIRPKNSHAYRKAMDFERFLSEVPIEKYRQELMSIKTVEQDLPRRLNPLPDIYKHYWTEEDAQFPGYEELFSEWWKSHLEPLDEFIAKFFWGCSRDFVYLGFKARIYRTIVSVWTQLHFCYLWKSYCKSPLEASPELDIQGVDALVNLNGQQVIIQIKKETYRSESRLRRRFAQQHAGRLSLEIPYTLRSAKDWYHSMFHSRTAHTREKAELFYFCSSKLQRWLDNGFVVFSPQYPLLVEKLALELLQTSEKQYYDWRVTLKQLKSMAEDERV
ncbi:hypothetical protein HRbin15_00040 [bacterium HR15]|nr:hypothetical protein HRbin15_00040 [bacterium HR15]